VTGRALDDSSIVFEQRGPLDARALQVPA